MHETTTGYGFEMTECSSQSRNPLPAFPCRDARDAKDHIILNPKTLLVLSGVLRRELHGERPGLQGVLVLCQEDFGEGKANIWTGDAGMFSGWRHEGRAAGENRACRSSLHISLYSSVLGSVTRHTRFNGGNSEEGAAPAGHFAGIDGFPCKHAMNMINRPVNGSV